MHVPDELLYKVVRFKLGPFLVPEPWHKLIGGKLLTMENLFLGKHNFTMIMP